MLFLPTELYNRCQSIFSDCHEFTDHATLASLFVTRELHPFKDRLPGATTKKDRITKCLKLLLESELSDHTPVLPFFIALLRDRYTGDALYDKLEQIRAEIETVSAIHTPFGVTLRYELIQPWKFDLRKPIEMCVNELLRRKQGVVGFGIAYDRPNFLEYFCKRLGDEWRPYTFSYTSDSLRIDPIEMPVDMASSTICEYGKDILQHGNVLFKVSLAGDDVVPFWQNLQDTLNDQKFQHRLVIIMATDSAGDWPQGIIPLPSPQCEELDIHKWAKELGASLHLPLHLIESLGQWMEKKCRCGEWLNIQLAYTNISFIQSRLKRNPTIQCFEELLALQERNVPYVKTSY